MSNNYVGAPNNRNHDTHFVEIVLLCSFNGFARKRIRRLIVRKTAAWLLERYLNVCRNCDIIQP